MSSFGTLTRRTPLGARMTAGPVSFNRAPAKAAMNQGKGRLTPKMTPKKGWYKGVGCRSLGFHTKKGGYRIVPAKVPVYVIPDLTDCPLKPYVSWSTQRVVVKPLAIPSEKELEQLQ